MNLIYAVPIIIIVSAALVTTIIFPFVIYRMARRYPGIMESAGQA